MSLTSLVRDLSGLTAESAVICRADAVKLADVSASDDTDQLAFSGAPTPRRPKPHAAVQLAKEDPVARTLLDVGLPHLDRPFDYAVPESMADDAVPGARVSVRFAGKEHRGYILERAAESDHVGQLAPLRRVISPEPVLAPEIAKLARAVADRYAGTVADVLRLAIPPRHARAEKRASAPAQSPAEFSAPAPDVGPWQEYLDGEALIAAVSRGSSPRAVWTAGPGAPWPEMLARLVVATLAAGRGAVVVVPDARDVARVDNALRNLIGADHHVVLTADLGPETRYRRWLAVRRGSVRAVVGTRSAVFAPVSDLGLMCVWDDGDDLHAELRAPYPHVREVALLRAHQTGVGAVIGGPARTAEAQQLVASGWARLVELPRSTVRSHAPRVRVSGDDWEQARDDAARTARLPSLAMRVARDGLERGPVLVQVPRSGYVPAVACTRCRTTAHCAHCGGMLRLGDRASGPSCTLCGARDSDWHCAECGGSGLRAIAVGVRRTAEELGRAFPGMPVVVSRGADIHDTVPDRPSLVLATPGAEPEVTGGYAAALLLDSMNMLGRADLRAAEEALRRWIRGASLVRSAGRGGEVVIVAEASVPAVQALVRWDPGGFAAAELDERAVLRFPPVARIAECTGAPADVDDLLHLLALPPGAEVAGPMEVDEGASRVVIRVPRASGSTLAKALRAAAGVRSARRSGGVVRTRIDPVNLA